ncbi:MAG TPA: septal ring lytic transglycosylase RlpA family protein [Methylobacter sp.]
MSILYFACGNFREESKESTVTLPIYIEIGQASWYGLGFQGQETANGETFDTKKMTTAHPSLPLGTKVEVINLEKHKKAEVRINDRGPF